MKNTGAGRNKKKKTIKERMLYYFDIWLSKGTLPTIILLFVITGLLVFVIALLAVMFGGKDSLASSLWDTMNHAFDPGVLLIVPVGSDWMQWAANHGYQAVDE